MSGASVRDFFAVRRAAGRLLAEAFCDRRGFMER